MPTRILYSPNGEPLSGGTLGQPVCASAMAGWFARVDANHDGFIARAEFLADARRQFAAMDLDKDGLVTPPELTQYRAPYEAVNAPGRSLSDTSSSRRGHDDSSSRPDQVDPVMIADVNLRNKVSEADFLAYAGRNFAALDKTHRGRLDLADIQAPCPH